MRLTVCMGVFGRKKVPCLLRGSSPDTPDHSLVTTITTASRKFPDVNKSRNGPIILRKIHYNEFPPENPYSRCRFLLLAYRQTDPAEGHPPGGANIL